MAVWPKWRKRVLKVTEEGPLWDAKYFTLEVGSEKSFMRFYIYHAQPDGLKVLPAWLGALAGFLSANNRGLFARWESLDNDILALARDQRQHGRLHHPQQQKALPPTKTEYDRDTYPSQITVLLQGLHLIQQRPVVKIYCLGNVLRRTTALLTNGSTFRWFNKWDGRPNTSRVLLWLLDIRHLLIIFLCVFSKISVSSPWGALGQFSLFTQPDPQSPDECTQNAYCCWKKPCWKL